jgi:hypothetical protein
MTGVCLSQKLGKFEWMNVFLLNIGIADILFLGCPEHSKHPNSRNPYIGCKLRYGVTLALVLIRKVNCPLRKVNVPLRKANGPLANLLF